MGAIKKAKTRELLGVTQRELAERFGVTERTIRRWLKDPQVRARIDEEVQAAFLGLYLYISEAVAVIIDLLHSDDDRMRAWAVDRILKYAGEYLGKLTNQQGENKKMSIEELCELIESAKQQAPKE